MPTTCLPYYWPQNEAPSILPAEQGTGKPPGIVVACDKPRQKALGHQYAIANA